LRRGYWDLPNPGTRGYDDIAAVRLIWTVDSSQTGSDATVWSVEPGMDIFKRQNDGTWKIIPYPAYTSPE
jgi:hypothetical protein